ncbi:hypothetical protein GY45DRAFT_1315346 [Cubamyces sp. BRFM 1775]|nr:hypothetical protein GY45DRAFT_1315346 [Cubamyces sp. BRFM 1775]
MNDDMPVFSDSDLTATDRFDYNLLVNTSLEGHMSFLSIIHRVTEVLQKPGEDQVHLMVKTIRGAKPAVVESFSRIEEARLGFDAANFVDVLGNPLRLHGAFCELYEGHSKRFNTFLAQSCKDADALGNFLQSYGKVLLVDVEQLDLASVVSELQLFVQGLDKKSQSLTEKYKAFDKLAEEIDIKLSEAVIVMEKAAARLSDDLRAVRAATGAHRDQITALLNRERLLGLYRESLGRNRATAVEKIKVLANIWERRT